MWVSFHNKRILSVMQSGLLMTSVCGCMCVCMSAPVRVCVCVCVCVCVDVRAQLVEQQRCLEQQTEMRVQLLQDLQDFFRKKAEIETEYSRNLEKLAERFMAKTRSTKDHQQYK